MDDDNWYYRHGETTAGPISRARLSELFRAGSITEQTLVWREGGVETNYVDEVERRSPESSGSQAPPGEEASSPPGLDGSPESGSALTAAEQTEIKGWQTAPVAPWRRYGARTLDTLIHGTVGGAILGFVWYSLAPLSADAFFNSLEGAWGRFFDLVFTLVMAAIIGSFVVGGTGTSIGKAILGIRVLNENLRPIGPSEGLKREFHILVTGLGFGIPILSLVTLIVAYRTLKRDGATSWDRMDYQVFYRQSGPFQSAMNALGIVLVVVALVTVQALNRM